MEELEQIIGYIFQNKKLLKQALTHSSYANEKKLGKLVMNVWNSWAMRYWNLSAVISCMHVFRRSRRENSPKREPALCASRALPTVRDSLDSRNSFSLDVERT